MTPKCDECGATCCYPNVDGPCWGEVLIEEEIAPGEYTHTCEGHDNYAYGPNSFTPAAYIPEPSALESEGAVS